MPRKIPVSGRLLVIIANDGQQLPGMPIPPGVKVTIRALPTNLGTVVLGGSKASVESGSDYPLVATDPPTQYELDELSALWMAGTSPGDGIAWTFEQRY